MRPDYDENISPFEPAHNPFTDYPEGEQTPAPGGRAAAFPMTVTYSLARNLVARRQKIWDCWGPSVVVGWIGDPAHQAECSDHNPDSGGVVHAIDPMVTGARAQAIVLQALAHPDDLQYVIHNGVIWSATTSWAARNWLGADPHTNHVHLSGRHGSSRKNSETCTGYNLAAEAATPVFDICPVVDGGDAMTLAEMQTLADLIGDAVVTKLVGKDLGKAGGGDTVGIVLQTGVLANSNKIVAALKEISAKLPEASQPPSPAA